MFAGAAIGASRYVAEEGAVVVLVGTDAAALGAVARDIENEGGRAAVVLGSFDDEATRAALAELLDELFGPVSS